MRTILKYTPYTREEVKKSQRFARQYTISSYNSLFVPVSAKVEWQGKFYLVTVGRKHAFSKLIELICSCGIPKDK